jgi:hypothetical protein
MHIEAKPTEVIQQNSADKLAVTTSAVRVAAPILLARRMAVNPYTAPNSPPNHPHHAVRTACTGEALECGEQEYNSSILR